MMFVRIKFPKKRNRKTQFQCVKLFSPFYCSFLCIIRSHKFHDFYNVNHFHVLLKSFRTASEYRGDPEYQRVEVPFSLQCLQILSEQNRMPLTSWVALPRAILTAYLTHFVQDTPYHDKGIFWICDFIFWESTTFPTWHSHRLNMWGISHNNTTALTYWCLHTVQTGKH